MYRDRIDAYSATMTGEAPTAYNEQYWMPREYRDLDWERANQGFNSSRPSGETATRIVRDGEAIDGTQRTFGSSPEAVARAREVLYDEERYLSPQEVATIVGLNDRVIHRAVNEGEIPAYKLRGKLRISRSDLNVWIEANRVEPYSVPEVEG